MSDLVLILVAWFCVIFVWFPCFLVLFLEGGALLAKQEVFRGNPALFDCWRALSFLLMVYPFVLSKLCCLGWP